MQFLKAYKDKFPDVCNEFMAENMKKLLENRASTFKYIDPKLKPS